MFTKKQYKKIAQVLKYESSNLLSFNAMTSCDIKLAMQTITTITEYFAYYVAKDFSESKDKFLNDCKGGLNNVYDDRRKTNNKAL